MARRRRSDGKLRTAKAAKRSEPPRASTPAPRRDPIWKVALVSAVVVVAFFALVEAVLAAAGVATLAAERDPFAGFSRRFPVFREDREKGVWATAPQARLHSFNQQEFRTGKPVNGFRVFVLGGSSAFGF